MRTGHAKWTSMSLFLLAVAGCGSDDPVGSSATVKAAGDFEGAWLGTDDRQRDHITLVLENGDLWAFHGPGRSSSLPEGFVQGNGRVNQSTSIPPGNPYFGAGDVRTLSVTGQPYNGLGDYEFYGELITGAGFTGNVNNNSGFDPGTTFADLPFPATQYRYDVPAAQADVAGNWSGTLTVGDLWRLEAGAFVGGAAGAAPSSIAIASDGAFTGASAGCNFAGTIRPRSGGKNVFDAKITFGASPCAYPGLVTNGVGLATLLPDGRNQIIVAATNVGRTTGALFAANR